MSNPNPFTILSSKIVYENPWIRVREDQNIRPDGSNGIYGVVESKDSVIVAAINDQQQIYIIHSYSYTAKAWRWELPAGNSDGEDTKLASKRELAEETGIVAKVWQQIGLTRVCDGVMTEKMATFVATNLQIRDRPSSDDVELIDDGKFATLDEIHELIATGDMDEGQSITALYLVERWLMRRASGDRV